MSEVGAWYPTASFTIVYPITHWSFLHQFSIEILCGISTVTQQAEPGNRWINQHVSIGTFSFEFNAGSLSSKTCERFTYLRLCFAPGSHVQAWQTKKLLKSQVCHSLARQTFFMACHTIFLLLMGKEDCMTCPRTVCVGSRLVCHLL